MEKIKLVVAQINLLVGDINGNTEKIIAAAKKAIEIWEADVVVFPELAICSYPPEDLLFRKSFYARSKKALQAIIDAKLNTTLIVGYPEQTDGKNFNMAAVIQNGQLIGKYAKQLLPNYTVFDEQRYFQAGHDAFVFPIKTAQFGLVICEDLWQPGPTQRTVNAGAKAIICINASPFDRNKAEVREKIIRDRALENKVPIIYANLVGGQDELVFDGGSMVFDAKGNCVQQAAYFKEDLLCVELISDTDVKVTAKTLPPRLSFEEKIYRALTLGVRDYIEKNHFPDAIIGLSGGIDSALTLAIAVDAIGADRVRTVLMPSRFTSEMSVVDAKILADNLNVHYDIIDIEPIFKAYLQSLAPVFGDRKPNAAEENIQARIRGMLLMAISNKMGSIVLTTGNKSELSVGYATLYGDMAGGFSVLKDIPKTLVYQLVDYRNRVDNIIPERIISRAPTAELAENQTDQDTLPPYPILDKILHHYIEDDMDPMEIYEKYKNELDLEVIRKVVAMVNQNEYKRRQAPVGIRTTERAFGKDRRYPITSGYTKNI